MTPALLLVLPAVAVAIAVAAVLLLRRRRTAPAAVRDALDTVQAWPPMPARVLSVHERQAYELLRRAAPGLLVLAQVPLARFLRVPTRHSYGDWMQRAGSLSADLLVCDAGSHVLAVVDVQTPQMSERSRRRHDRLARVLKAAGIRVLVWREGELPALADVRSVLAGLLETAPARPAVRGAAAAAVDRALAAGDRAHEVGDTMEPVPSAFFDEVESTRV